MSVNSSIAVLADRTDINLSNVSVPGIYHSSPPSVLSIENESVLTNNTNVTPNEVIGSVSFLERVRSMDINSLFPRGSLNQKRKKKKRNADGSPSTSLSLENVSGSIESSVVSEEKDFSVSSLNLSTIPTESVSISDSAHGSLEKMVGAVKKPIKRNRKKISVFIGEESTVAKNESDLADENEVKSFNKRSYLRKKSVNVSFDSASLENSETEKGKMTLRRSKKQVVNVSLVNVSSKNKKSMKKELKQDVQSLEVEKENAKVTDLEVLNESNYEVLSDNHGSSSISNESDCNIEINESESSNLNNINHDENSQNLISSNKNRTENTKFRSQKFVKKGLRKVSVHFVDDASVLLKEDTNRDLTLSTKESSADIVSKQSGIVLEVKPVEKTRQDSTIQNTMTNLQAGLMNEKMSVGFNASIASVSNVNDNSVTEVNRTYDISVTEVNRTYDIADGEKIEDNIGDPIEPEKTVSGDHKEFDWKINKKLCNIGSCEESLDVSCISANLEEVNSIASLGNGAEDFKILEIPVLSSISEGDICKKGSINDKQSNNLNEADDNGLSAGNKFAVNLSTNETLYSESETSNLQSKIHKILSHQTRKQAVAEIDLNRTEIDESSPDETNNVGKKNYLSDADVDTGVSLGSVESKSVLEMEMAGNKIPENEQDSDSSDIHNFELKIDSFELEVPKNYQNTKEAPSNVSVPDDIDVIENTSTLHGNKGEKINTNIIPKRISVHFGLESFNSTFNEDAHQKSLIEGNQNLGVSEGDFSTIKVMSNSISTEPSKSVLFDSSELENADCEIKKKLCNIGSRKVSVKFSNVSSQLEGNAADTSENGVRKVISSEHKPLNQAECEIVQDIQAGETSENFNNSYVGRSEKEAGRDSSYIDSIKNSAELFSDKESSSNLGSIERQKIRKTCNSKVSVHFGNDESLLKDEDTTEITQNLRSSSEEINNLSVNKSSASEFEIVENESRSNSKNGVIFSANESSKSELGEISFQKKIHKILSSQIENKSSDNPRPESHQYPDKKTEKCCEVSDNDEGNQINITDFESAINSSELEISINKVLDVDKSHEFNGTETRLDVDIDENLHTTPSSCQKKLHTDLIKRRVSVHFGFSTSAATVNEDFTDKDSMEDANGTYDISNVEKSSRTNESMVNSIGEEPKSVSDELDNSDFKINRKLCNIGSRKVSVYFNNDVSAQLKGDNSDILDKKTEKNLVVPLDQTNYEISKEVEITNTNVEKEIHEEISNLVFSKGSPDIADEDKSNKIENRWKKIKKTGSHKVSVHFGYDSSLQIEKDPTQMERDLISSKEIDLHSLEKETVDSFANSVIPDPSFITIKANSPKNINTNKVVEKEIPCPSGLKSNKGRSKLESESHDLFVEKGEQSGLKIHENNKDCSKDSNNIDNFELSIDSSEEPLNSKVLEIERLTSPETNKTENADNNEKSIVMIKKQENESTQYTSTSITSCAEPVIEMKRLKRDMKNHEISVHLDKTSASQASKGLSGNDIKDNSSAPIEKDYEQETKNFTNSIISITGNMEPSSTMKKLNTKLGPREVSVQFCYDTSVHSNGEITCSSQLNNVNNLDQSKCIGNLVEDRTNTNQNATVDSVVVSNNEISAGLLINNNSTVGNQIPVNKLKRDIILQKISVNLGCDTLENSCEMASSSSPIKNSNYQDGLLPVDDKTSKPINSNESFNGNTLKKVVVENSFDSLSKSECGRANFENESNSQVNHRTSSISASCNFNKVVAIDSEDNHTIFTPRNPESDVNNKNSVEINLTERNLRSLPCPENKHENDGESHKSIISDENVSGYRKIDKDENKIIEINDKNQFDKTEKTCELSPSSSYTTSIIDGLDIQTGGKKSNEVNLINVDNVIQNKDRETFCKSIDVNCSKIPVDSDDSKIVEKSNLKTQRDRNLSSGEESVQCPDKILLQEEKEACGRVTDDFLSQDVPAHNLRKRSHDNELNRSNKLVKKSSNIKMTEGPSIPVLCLSKNGTCDKSLSNVGNSDIIDINTEKRIISESSVVDAQRISSVSSGITSYKECEEKNLCPKDLTISDHNRRNSSAENELQKSVLNELGNSSYLNHSNKAEIEKQVNNENKVTENSQARKKSIDGSSRVQKRSRGSGKESVSERSTENNHVFICPDPPALNPRDKNVSNESLLLSKRNRSDVDNESGDLESTSKKSKTFSSNISEEFIEDISIIPNPKSGSKKKMYHSTPLPANFNKNKRKYNRQSSEVSLKENIQHDDKMIQVSKTIFGSSSEVTNASVSKKKSVGFSSSPEVEERSVGSSYNLRKKINFRNVVSLIDDSTKSSFVAMNRKSVGFRSVVSLIDNTTDDEIRTEFVQSSNNLSILNRDSAARNAEFDKIDDSINKTEREDDSSLVYVGEVPEIILPEHEIEESIEVSKDCTLYRQLKTISERNKLVKKQKFPKTKIARNKRNLISKNSNNVENLETVSLEKWVSPNVIKFLNEKLMDDEFEYVINTNRIISILCSAVNAVKYLTNVDDIEMALLPLKHTLVRFEICNNMIEYCSFISRFTPFEFQCKALPLGGYFGSIKKTSHRILTDTIV